MSVLAVLLAMMQLLPGFASGADGLPLHRWAWQTWSSESGLPQISGKALAIDHDGLVWVGTENGLARFDGSHFEVFTPGNTPELAASWITRLHVDREGRLWIGNLRNVAVFVDGRFIGSDELGEVTALAQVDDGGMLIGGDRLYRATLDGDRLQLTQAAADTGAVSALLAVPEQGVWIGERGGHLRHRLDGRDRRVPLPSQLTRITALAQLNGDVWLGGDAGLFRHDGSGFQPVAFAPADSGTAVQALAGDAQGTLWIASHGNAYRRFADGRIETVGSHMAHAFPWVVAFLPTADGIWMGSHYHGLRHYWLPTVQRLGSDDGLHDPSVWSVVPDGGALLVGTDDGVARWDGTRFRQLLAGSRLPHPVAYSVLRDRQRRLWVGTRSGLVRFSADLQQRLAFAELRGAQVNGMRERPDGSVWIASAAGLFRHPPDADGPLLEQVNVNGILSGIRVRALAWASDGALWIGTESGLFRHRDKHFEQVLGTGMDGVFVTSVRAFDDGRVVVGSYDRGITVGWPDGRWQHHAEATGLPSDTVFNLQPVADGVLVSFSDGVYHWPLPEPGAATPPYRMLIHDIGDRPGRSRTRCCNGAGNDKGAIHEQAYWLPSLNGLVRVPLDAPPPPTPTVDVLGVNGQRPDARPVLLDPAQRGLTLRFRSIDYRHGFRLRFRHRLDGVDTHWLDTPSRDSVSYAQLPAGRFRFDIQARLPYQPWGETTSLQIHAPARFSETWTFRALLLLALALLLYALMRWRERLLRQQKQKLEDIITTRTGELAVANLRLGELNQVLNEASLCDPLTGLGNRRHLLRVVSTLQSQVRAAWRAGATTPVLGVLVVDIDHFKHINDALGHLAGDAVLCRIARLLTRTVGSADGLARWGGEEFVVVTTAAAVPDLLEKAEHLRRAVEGELIEVSAGRQVTASVGVAAWPTMTATLDRHDWSVSLALADFALYRAKVSGRNRSALIVVTGVAPEDWGERPDAATLRKWLDQGRAELHLRP